MTTNQIIGPGIERKKIKIYNSPEEYFKSEAFKEEQRIQEEKENKNNINSNKNLEWELEGHVYVPSLHLFISKERHFINGTYEKIQKTLHEEISRMPTLYEFVEFIKYLKSDEGSKKIKDAKNILDEIFNNKYPLRGEWIDGHIKRTNGNYFLNYHHFNETYFGIKKTEKIIKPSFHIQRIDLDDYLNKHDELGFPLEGCTIGNLEFNIVSNDSIIKIVNIPEKNKIVVDFEENYNLNYDNIKTRCVKRIIPF